MTRTTISFTGDGMTLIQEAANLANEALRVAEKEAARQR
jgi:hypothetical protein